MRKSIDWVAMYDYPSNLRKLRPGDVGIFVCPSAWRGRLSTVCGIWVKASTDWMSDFPSGTPWAKVFWTEAHPEGLLVARAAVQRLFGRRAPRRFKCQPSSEVSSRGSEDLQQMMAGWSPAKQTSPRAGATPKYQ